MERAGRSGPGAWQRSRTAVGVRRGPGSVQDAEGLFPGPTVIEEDVRNQYGAHVIGRIESVRERFYVVSVERRVQNQAVAAIVDAAREKLFD